jgi:tetratricopeptide (TPR) repeat protein
VLDRLRPLWDFGDLDSSERRLREQLAAEETPAGRAEVLTQLARVEALRNRFAESEELLREAEALDGRAVVRARVALERGRLLRSSGDADAAYPLFESAVALALEADLAFIAADATHMAALAAPDRDAMRAWTRRGVELAERHEHARYWLGPLLNNLGWAYYDDGEHEQALDAFRRALAAREEEPERAEEIEIARYAVGKALRALDRADEAAPLLERAVAWAEAARDPDAYFHEELAEIYAALGRDDDAAEQARRALALLPSGDERVARLLELG